MRTTRGLEGPQGGQTFAARSHAVAFSADHPHAVAFSADQVWAAVVPEC